LQHAIEDVDNQIALLHARVAALDKSNASWHNLNSPGLRNCCRNKP
jgi:hypothetical protein